ncbi:unnamed protein product [Lepidochelys kempii]
MLKVKLRANFYSSLQKQIRLAWKGPLGRGRLHSLYLPQVGYVHLEVVRRGRDHHEKTGDPNQELRVAVVFAFTFHLYERALQEEEIFCSVYILQHAAVSSPTRSLTYSPHPFCWALFQKVRVEAKRGVDHLQVL